MKQSQKYFCIENDYLKNTVNIKILICHSYGGHGEKTFFFPMKCRDVLRNISKFLLPLIILFGTKIYLALKLLSPKISPR